MRFQILSASQMLSLMAATTLGLFLISSRAKRTAQMNAAAMRRAFLGGSDTEPMVGEYMAKGQAFREMQTASSVSPDRLWRSLSVSSIHRGRERNF